jgi:predicted benzoate:H+ symporter BenE
MKPSTAWSCLAFSLALASYSMNRDISANVFLACVFIIQGLKRTDGSKHEGLTSVLAFALSAGIVIFSASNLIDGSDKSAPAHFRYKH